MTVKTIIIEELVYSVCYANKKTNKVKTERIQGSDLNEEFVKENNVYEVKMV